MVLGNSFAKLSDVGWVWDETIKRDAECESAAGLLGGGYAKRDVLLFALEIIILILTRQASVVLAPFHIHLILQVQRTIGPRLEHALVGLR